MTRTLQTDLLYNHSINVFLLFLMDCFGPEQHNNKRYSLWGPVQCLTFGVVPQHLRIAFIALVSFFWLIIFSSVTAKGQKEREMVDDSCSLEDGVTCSIDG